MEERKVIWTASVQEQLKEIYLFIARDSIKQADIIFEKLINSSEKIINNPYKYPKDQYKIENDGNYRAYELFHYRISYKITTNIIYIIRIRSAYRNPKKY